MPSSAPAAPAKPGSARERMSADLQKLADKGQPSTATAKPTPKSAPTEPAGPEAAETPAGSPAETPIEPGDNVETTVSTPEGAPPKKGEKVSPWKLVETYKARTATLEKEIADLKAKAIPETERTVIQERLTKAETRAKELEDEMRYVNYAKSDEFKQKYEEPYQKAWKRALSELEDLTIEPDGEARRAVKMEDILQLVNMPLGQAREVADQMFGKFGDDVMAHRKEIRRLFEEQAGALEEAKKNGAQRDAQRMEEFQRNSKILTEQVSNLWKTSNDSASTDPKYGKYFTPVEGDEHGNQRLAKGFELVDRAFSENPHDPKLTPEQRASVVKRHAAVRNRAAAFGRMVYLNEQLESKVSALEKELAQFKESTPEAGSGAKTPAQPGQSTARDQIFGALHKLAK